MPFIPHTNEDTATMIQTIGVTSTDALFDEIPSVLQIQELKEIPDGLNEMTLSRLMQERSEKDSVCLNFIGAGAYEHHIPAAVWKIASRGEWMTAYTPYQAEASQGTLQLLYEYQTLMANLMQMEVSNASLYDGASALAEAVLMAVRCHKPMHSVGKRSVVLLPSTLHPNYRQVVKTIVQAQDIEIIELPYSKETGTTELNALKQFEGQNVSALIIPQPNFFGVLEEVDALTDWAHANAALAIGVVNPLSTALLKPPGGWGKKGADIACGEGQPLGVPLASGGPYFGFLCCRKEIIRQLPGRLVGRTVDSEGREGFVLTLQAREQHIRRSKATSNICTNQGLLVTAATIYMSLLGPEGLTCVAAASHANTRYLQDQLKSIPDIHCLFQSPFFHEIVLRFSIPVERIITELSKQGFQAGLNLTSFYPELGDCLLVCATETKTKADLDAFVTALQRVIQRPHSAED